MPWWHDPKTVAFLGGIFSAIIPTTTAVQGWFEKQKAIEMNELLEHHKMRMDYVNKALTRSTARRRRATASADRRR